METRIPPRSSNLHFREAKAEGRLDHRLGSHDCMGRESFFHSSFSRETAEMGDEAAAPPDRAMAATVNHREAERRRRERIKLHLDRLRSILACDAKTEKASLLAKAVQHVRDLKRRAAEVGEMDDRIPTESDEVSVHVADLEGGAAAECGEGRRPILRASLCCEDRSGLLPELSETLKSLRLSILRAEISSIGGRVRSVLVVAGEDGSGEAAFLTDALKALAEGSGGTDRLKRRRIGRSSTMD